MFLLQLIFEAGVSCTIASVRANLARMVGTLGCLMVAQSTEEILKSGTAFVVLTAATEYLLKVSFWWTFMVCLRLSGINNSHIGFLASLLHVTFHQLDLLSLVNKRLRLS